MACRKQAVRHRFPRNGGCRLAPQTEASCGNPRSAEVEIRCNPSGKLALCRRLPLKNLFTLTSLTLAASFVFCACPWTAAAQSLNFSNSASSAPTAAHSDLDGSAFASSSLAAIAPDPSAAPALPSAPEPAGAGYDHYEVAPSATWHQIPFSRVGIGANVSPLGIGIEGAIVLNHYFDGRVNGNFFNYDTGRFEVDGFNVDAKLHMASVAAALDWYPLGSVWRISPGVMFFNGNQLSGTGTITSGSSFQLENQTYYSANPNPATGATPLVGTGVLGLHTHTPAFTVTGGFGKFIPRSNRHWSFPSEFGVAFTGAPTINVNLTGWACLDARQTECSNVADPTSPIAIDFNDNLQARLNSWRRDLNKVQVYPIFAYSVVYSFNIR